MFVILDINEVWRYKPSQALSRYTPLLGVCPKDIITSIRKGQPVLPVRSLRKVSINYYTLSITMLPSWATRLAFIAQYFLWKDIRAVSKKLNQKIEYLIITIPHYYQMLKWISGDIKVIYYVSDDYRLYQGWDAVKIIAWEEMIIQRAAYVFFVSQSLADRAKLQFPKYINKIYVSMNATESAFLANEMVEIVSPPEPYSQLKRPILGVIGSINDSLDFDLLLSCANLPETGTLLFVGPCYEQKGLDKLIANPKVVFAGEQPHTELPQWMQSIDLALIPYKNTQFNHNRSPMRLFDHLASGRPVLATSACDQVVEFKDYVSIARNEEEYLALLKKHLLGDKNESKRHKQIKFARSQTWEYRMAALYDVLQQKEQIINELVC